MTSIPTCTFGSTGVTVTKLGYGAMELRGAVGPWGRPVEPIAAGAILNQVLDAGINFIDTSPDYGTSEELIGAHISARRDEFFLASKCGCAVDPTGAVTGFAEHSFTRQNVRAGVEQSLRRMKTDHLDLVQFHASPSQETLEENGSVEELKVLQDEGKIRFIGMSGVLPNLEDHIKMGVFDAFQIPYSALERQHEGVISEAARAGAGVIVRGGVARGMPVADDKLIDGMPEGFRDVLRSRREDFKKSDLADLLEGITPMEFMLRFTITHPDMHTTIVGTSNPDHLADNLEAASKGPLPSDIYEEAKLRLSASA